MSSSSLKLYVRLFEFSLRLIRTKALKQLSELQPAPSVGMHDVPRESVGHHLGFAKDEEEGRDSLDASVARESHHVSRRLLMLIVIRLEHARFVYNLQEAETHSEDSDDPDGYRWDSDNSVASSSRRRHAPKAPKKRMSILTNQYYDIPSYENGFECAVPGKSDSRRRFFQSVARWDTRYQKVVVPGRAVSPLPKNLYPREEPQPPVIAPGPRYFDDEGVVGDWGDDNGSAEDDGEATSDALETESGDGEEMSVMLD